MAQKVHLNSKDYQQLLAQQKYKQQLIPWQIFNKMVCINRSDQQYRSTIFNASTHKKQKEIDSANAMEIIALTRQYGWLWSYRFDTAATDDTQMPWELFALISHFKREEIKFLRDTARMMASRNEISWDEVVMLQQALYWKKPQINQTNDLYYPLEVELNDQGKVTWRNSFFALYTLGRVVLSGFKNTQILLSLNDNYCRRFNPKAGKTALKEIKCYLVRLGVNPKNVVVGNNVFYTASHDDSPISYRAINGFGGGRINWFPPYNLIVF